MKYDIESILEMYEDDYTPSAMVPGPRNMKLAQVPRSEMDNFNTPDLDQGADSILRPGETLEDFDVEFRRPNAQGGRLSFKIGLTPIMQERINNFESKTKEKYLEQNNQKKKDIRDGKWKGTGKGTFFKKENVDFYKKRSAGTEIQKIRNYLSNALKENKGKPITFKTIEEIKKAAGVTANIGADIARELQKDTFSNKINLRNFDKLPDEVIKDIKGTFDYVPKDKWDFNKYKFGINKTDIDERVYDKVRNFVKDPKPSRYGFGFGKPEGWMLVQMDRAYRSGNKNYKPIYAMRNGIKKVVGYVDNTEAGGGKKWFHSNDYIKGKNSDGIKIQGDGKIKAHPDYAENVKYHDIVQKAGKQPNKAILEILKTGGVLDQDGMYTTKTGAKQSLQLRHVMNYVLDSSDYSVARNSIVRHHKGQLNNATSDLQILDRVKNAKVIGIEDRISKNNILPDDIAKLKRYGVSVRGPDGTLYGSGPKTASGGLKEINKLILEGSTDQELYGKKVTGLKDFKNKDFKQLAGYLEKLGCGQAAGGRILFSNGTPGASLTECGKKGIARFMDDLKKGNYSKASLNILKGGGNIIKNIANPMELLKLRNLIGPGAMGLMAAYEGGVITDDVIRQGTPLNESLANNWLTKTFLPYTKQYAEAKNLLETGKVPSNMKKYVQDVVTFNESLKDMEGIQGNVDSRLVDVGGYGMGDGTSMYSKEKEDKDVNNLIKKMSTISEDVITPGTGKALEMKALQNEMKATRMAKPKIMGEGSYLDEAGMEQFSDGFQYSDGFSSIFGFDKLKDVRTPGSKSFDYIPEETPKDLRPITYKDYEKKELPSAERQYYENKYNIKPRSSLSEYYLPGAKVNVLDELTSKYNMREAAKYPGFFSADSEKFSEGGITTLRSKYEYKK